MSKRLVTESDVLDAARRGVRILPVEPGTILTPAAMDAATTHGIEISASSPDKGTTTSFQGVTFLDPPDARSPNATTLVALGSDHGGFQLKEQLKAFLLAQGFPVADVGTMNEAACDYPDFAYAVAALVAQGRAARGIMIDAVGIASAIAANKVPGIRAVPCWSEFVARSSREHNDANVLTLGGKVLGVEVAKAIVKTWLETWFGGGRHLTRVKKITEIEKRLLK
ncbi:MAG: ribose 5-phosphate isomerase B [Bacteroidota bacterium]